MEKIMIVVWVVFGRLAVAVVGEFAVALGRLALVLASMSVVTMVMVGLAMEAVS